jgi:hypothetical protein
MCDWWREQWSLGEGQSRVYCGIARTKEGYAVDVFRGDTCVDSFPYGNRQDAIDGAWTLKLQVLGADRFGQPVAK